VNRFEAMSWPEVARRSEAGGILLIPLGSTEQHGPHLPVTTDTDIATAIATVAAERDGSLVVAPALPYGSSGEHQAFAGTLSIGQEATELALLELGRSAAQAFDHVIVVSAHGGNAAPVARAMARLTDEGRSVTAWSPRWDGDLHAGRTETSVMLAIAPRCVHLEKAEAGDTRPLAELYPLMQRDGVRAVSSNGVLGDPAGASAEEGRLLLDAAVADLLGLAQRLRNTPTMEVTR
jgi:mycofactocin system creatininase family protein